MNRQQNKFRRREPENKEFEEKVIKINRCSKKTKGGNKMSFSALMVVGNKKGKVGVALGKAPDTLSAIKKGTRKARKKIIKFSMKKSTIPFPLYVKRGAAKILLKPAPEGTGVIAGGAARAVVEAAGIRDIVVKILGTSNKASNVYATFEGLKKIQKIASKKQFTKKESKETTPPKKEEKKEKTIKNKEKKPTPIKTKTKKK